MGMKEGTCLMLYGSAESLHRTPETNMTFRYLTGI